MYALDPLGLGGSARLKVTGDLERKPGPPFRFIQPRPRGSRLTRRRTLRFRGLCAASSWAPARPWTSPGRRCGPGSVPAHAPGGNTPRPKRR